ncbi:uncharacterized protein A1O9_01865 [Exophiala aquamarina CBS 119918]|uniref:Uncharacterized protein n=1 Tax=Exophiala aquamarina CBS 119918 TaxID=1182545 RepID=A0A072PXK0_9EURO|nr:uncharacterized protein A1O9_01865 [Exophiala aquamarina CBS 119918]KEF60305.1 hypothetical protein A1O9_01865 [Exophiala aquamarina CBS 119918]
MLMQASIVTVTLGYFQHLITQASPVPFGSIFFPYQITQMNYLWSQEFLATLNSPHFAGLKKIVFVLFVPSSILLAAGVGPCSAIALQPRQTNFTVPSYRVAMNATDIQLYPTILDQPGPPLAFSLPSRNELSPAAGWKYLHNFPAVGSDQNTEVGAQQKAVSLGKQGETTIYVMPQLYSAELVTYHPWFATNSFPSVSRTMYIQYAPNSTFATVPHVTIAQSMLLAGTRFAQHLGDKPGTAIASIEEPQPFSSVRCMFNPIHGENDTDPIQFPNTYVAGCLGDLECLKANSALNEAGKSNFSGISKQSIWEQAQQIPGGRIIWVDGIEISSPDNGTALGAIVIPSEVCPQSNISSLMVSACVIGGRWASTKSFIRSTSNGLDLLNGLVENLVSVDSLAELPQWSNPSVKLSKAWAESLEAITDVLNRTVVDNLIRQMPITDNICPNGTSEGRYQISLRRPFMYERLLATLVANGMSHAAGAIEEWFWYPSPKQTGGWVFTDPNTFEQKSQKSPPGVVLTFEGHLPGFAWNLDGIPIKIVLPVLMVYCLYTLSYVLFTFITGRSSMAWRSISQMTALAINSTPTDVLDNTSAGIEHKKTFAKPISVREVENHRRLELIFTQDEDKRGPLRRVNVGRGY